MCPSNMANRENVGYWRMENLSSFVLDFRGLLDLMVLTEYGNFRIKLLLLILKVYGK